MVKIKDLPLLERPREKAQLYGIETLTNSELLALIIANGTKKESALDIANHLLVELGGIENLKYANIKDLSSISGINDVKALHLLAIIELEKRINKTNKKVKVNEDFIVNYFHNVFKNQNQEKAYILLINGKNELLFIKEIFSGNENTIAFSSQIVISQIVKYNAKGYYLIHNHPSGNPTPSENDILSTNSIEFVTYGLSCKLIDHLIFGDQCYYSMNKKSSFTIEQAKRPS